MSVQRSSVLNRRTPNNQNIVQTDNVNIIWFNYYFKVIVHSVQENNYQMHIRHFVQMYFEDVTHN